MRSDEHIDWPTLIAERFQADPDPEVMDKVSSWILLQSLGLRNNCRAYIDLARLGAKVS